MSNYWSQDAANRQAGAERKRHSDFKRSEHDAEWKREQEIERERKDAERGPWYIRIDGKIYKQKGQPKAFDWKKGANNYALAMLKDKPDMIAKTQLTKNPKDNEQPMSENDMTSFFKDLQKNNPKFKNLRVHGDPEHDELRKQDEIERQKRRAADDERNNQARSAAVEKDRANLPELKALLQKLTAHFDPQYDYSDDYSFWSKQKDLHTKIQTLKSRIAKAENQGVAEAGVDPNAPFDYDAWAKSGKKPSQPGKAVKQLAQQTRDAQKKKQQGVAEGSTTMWEVCFDYGPHMSDTVKVKASSEDEAIAKVEKAAEKRGRSIDINWVKPAKPGVAEGFAEGEDVDSFKNSLHTIVRVASHLEKNIADDEHFEEWVVEKVGAAKSMIVAVMDYIISAHEQGHGDHMDNGDSVDKANLELGMNEWKKSHKAPIKPRNFVAKNATTGGAGAHKDKKKDAKQGKEKHKKKPELAESATYARKLNVLYETKLLTEKIRSLKK